MTKKFEVGDKVRIVESQVPARRGMVTKIVAYWGSGTTIEGPVKDYYTVDVAQGIDPNDGLSVTADIREDWLELIYDGNQLSSWSECVWKPKELSRAS